MQGAIRSCLTAGIALVGVGVITVAPVVPQLPEIQVSSMPTPAGEGGATSADSASAWLRVFEHGGIQNLSQIGASVSADSVPGLRQLAATQFDLSRTLASSGLATGAGLTQWAGLPVDFRAVIDALPQGDVVSTTTAPNGALGGTSLIPSEVFLDVLQIPVQITDKLTNVVRVVVSLATLQTLFVGAIGPIEAVIAATGDAGQAVLDGLRAGDTDAAISAFIAAPGTIAGAFLTGYTNSDGSRYPGIFTVDTENPATGGLLQTLFVTLPRAILTALGLSPTAPSNAAATQQDRVAAVPKLDTPVVTVDVAQPTRATSAPRSAAASKDAPATTAAPAEDDTTTAPTTVTGDVASAPVVKGSNKVGADSKPAAAPGKPKAAASTAAKKSSGSRSSRSAASE
ncbi:hypothetical protein [Mycolicibacterium komossense]|uniref:PE-PGRS family protein n=1 Tax=Mycolicibacterium komossense TaxID=1779 RepID=A0ABT3C7D4_9MYCO|nr:hypothetical protein [Mycolicibacterium komossense]MCV7225363.1 hypothetical protein [Mycolicibacterium komossense]